MLLLYIINPSVYIKEHACIYTTRREREKKRKEDDGGSRKTVHEKK
jgi:hypothetical protein